MKYLLKINLFVIATALLFFACDKKDNLPAYAKGGTTPVLSASATTITPQITDSGNIVLTLNWTNPNYAVDSSTVQYVIEVDSSGRNFAKEAKVIVNGALTTSFTAAQLNSILLGFGFAYNTAYPVDIRVTSSYANNNQQLQSNTVTVNFTTYVVPPKVTPPSAQQLFLVGDATVGGWNNPVPAPAQQFTEVDSVTYQGTFFLIGGKQYLILPVNGDWSNKYAISDFKIPATGGSFGYNGNDGTYNTNFNAPATTGMYKITLNFQSGTFTVAPAGVYGMLYVPGDYQGWSLSESTPILGSPQNNGNYDGYINVPAGGTNEFQLTTSTDWSTALFDGGGGTLSSSSGVNLKFPASGYYHVVANTTNNTWAVYPITTWGLIGSFAASNWGTDIPMTYDASSNTWTAIITTAAGDQFKFRANNSWDGTNQNPNYGDTGADGQLELGGDNISISAGTHTITLFLGNGGYYTYQIQ